MLPEKQLSQMTKAELAALSPDELQDLMQEAADTVLRPEVSWKCCGQWWGLVRTHCPVCRQAHKVSGPTESERLEMCGPDPVRNSDLGL